MVILKMNLIACSLLMLICFLALAKVLSLDVSGQDSPTTREFQTYDGSKYGISIQYPDGWKIIEDSTGVWFTSPVNDSANVRVQSQSNLNASLTDLVQVQLLESKNSNKDLSIISSNMTTIGGTPANRTDYKFKVEVPKLLGADIFDYNAIKISAIKGQKLYTITYFSDPENFYIFLPIVQKMLSTATIY